MKIKLLYNNFPRTLFDSTSGIDIESSMPCAIADLDWHDNTDNSYDDDIDPDTLNITQD